MESDDVERSGPRQVVVSLRRLVVTGIVVVLAVGAGWLGWVMFEHHRQDVASAQALEAAKDYTTTLSNIDYGTVDKSLDELRDRTTDELNALHAQDSARIRKAVIDKKVTAHGEIVEATVVSAAGDRVKVQLVVDQRVADIDNPEPEIERNRVTLTMDKVDGRWLTSNVDL